jgi:hypothetical protein
MKRIVSVLCLSIIGFLAGCTTPSSKIDILSKTETLYPPSTNIDTLKDFPEKPYIVIGEVIISNLVYYKENATTFIQQKGKEMGANAVVVQHECSKKPCIQTLTDGKGNGVLVMSRDTMLRATLIKYKDANIPQ